MRVWLMSIISVKDTFIYTLLKKQKHFKQSVHDAFTTCKDQRKLINSCTDKCMPHISNTYRKFTGLLLTK